MPLGKIEHEATPSQATLTLKPHTLLPLALTLALLFITPNPNSNAIPNLTPNLSPNPNHSSNRRQGSAEVADAAKAALQAPAITPGGVLYN